MLGFCFCFFLVHNLKGVFYFTKVFARSPENTTSIPIYLTYRDEEAGGSRQESGPGANTIPKSSERGLQGHQPQS